MNKELIPQKLHHLIPLVEKWGIDDDGYRDQMIYNSTIEDLENLVESFTDQDADILNIWLNNPQLINSPTVEYIKFSAFFMAYEYAESLLKNRKQ